MLQHALHKCITNHSLVITCDYAMIPAGAIDWTYAYCRWRMHYWDQIVENAERGVSELVANVTLPKETNENGWIGLHRPGGGAISKFGTKKKKDDSSTTRGFILIVVSGGICCSAIDSTSSLVSDRRWRRARRRNCPMWLHSVSELVRLVPLTGACLVFILSCVFAIVKK